MKEINFVVLRPQTITDTISQDELKILNKIMRDCLLSHVTYHDFRFCTALESGVVEMCERYGINPRCSEDRVSLFEALLKAIDSEV